MWVLVGLGNPGRKYSKTRHNVGFFFIKQVAKDWNFKIKGERYSSRVVEVERKNEQVLLAMPQSYMNRSGQAVGQILERTREKPEQLIVIYDDLDIPLGEIRIRKEGSPGSHKGMISIVREINSIQFPRIRIGIGPLSPGVSATDYVLSPFEREEKSILKESLGRAQMALELILDGEIEKAMNLYNQRTRSKAT